MRRTVRGIAMAGVGWFLGAEALWAHPGHVTEGGVWHTLTHTLSSPYHVVVVCAVAVLAVALTLLARPARDVAQEEREAKELR